MNKHYKLVINNKKKILKEDLSGFKFSQITGLVSDLYKIASNTFKATFINLMAQVEWMVISSNVKGFANLEHIQQNFEKKINESNRLFNDAIPSSIKDDVDVLFNITNPGAFVSSNIVDTLKNADVANNVPFGWFAKRVITGDFERFDVKPWGQGQPPFEWIKFNNIMWYKGWLYKDMIIDNVDRLKSFVNKGGLAKLSDEGLLTGIKDENDLKKKLPLYSLFVGAVDVMKIYNGASLSIYDFFKKSEGDFTNLAIRIAQCAGKLGADGNQAEVEREFVQISETYQRLINNFIKSLNDWTQNTQKGFDKIGKVAGNIVDAFTGSQSDLSLQNLNGNPVHDLPKMKSGLNIITDFASGKQGFLSSVWDLGKSVTSGALGLGESKNYVLKLNNNQKILTEDIKNETNNKVNNLKKVGVDTDKTDLNEAQQAVLSSVMDDKTKNQYVKTWQNSLSKMKQIKPSDSQEKKVLLFLEMAEFSAKFFDKMKGDLTTQVEKVKDTGTTQNQAVNKELTNKFKFELTPQGFAKKAAYDFELLCQTTKNSLISYLIIIEPILKEFEILVSFIRKDNENQIMNQINNLKRDMNEKLNIYKNDKNVEKKFEEIYKGLEKTFQKDSQTLQNFKNIRTDAAKLLEEGVDKINSFCDDLMKGIEESKKLSEIDQLKNLLQLIDAMQENNKTTKDKIYSDLLPNLLKQNKIFSTDIQNQKNELNKKYEKLLNKMDYKSFDNIYDENKKSFDEIYKNCIAYIGTSYDNSKFKQNEAIVSDLKEKYSIEKEKLEKTVNVKDAEKVEGEVAGEGEEEKKDSSMAADLFNKVTKNINPISVK